MTSSGRRSTGPASWRSGRSATAPSPSPRGRGGHPYLRLEQLTKRFGAFTALDGISLEIYEGEFVCFLGPSGCGKTTLLRAIAGLDLQTSGRVEQAGRDISSLPATRRDFGIVFQSYALFPNLTVAKNVAYGLENARRQRREVARRVAELLDMVDLGAHAEKYPGQLSGGQQQRVALARALATSPGLLLLDEPLSALDAKVRVYLRRELRQLQRRLGVTTIMVTHDQEEALTLADRIVVMNQGVIEQVGTPLEVYREPGSPFVADFVGVMNFVAATVAAAGAVRIGALELGCDVDGLPPGREVTLAIRPEEVTVREGGEALARPARPDGADNVVAARVEGLAFLGSFFRAELVAEGARELRVRCDLPVDLVRRHAIAEGARLAVELPRDRIRVYPGAIAHR